MTTLILNDRENTQRKDFEARLTQDVSVSNKDSEKQNDHLFARSLIVASNLVHPVTLKKYYRKKGFITRCKHTDQAHYAKGMCNHCYHTKGRVVLATECIHLERASYAKKMCRNCYFTQYNKNRAIPSISKQIKKKAKIGA